MSPKQLGIIGGAGPYASALFYRRLLDELYKQGKEIGEMVIINYPFTHPHACETLEELDQKLCKELQQCTSLFMKVGIDQLVIVCNTLHAYLQEISPKLSCLHLPQTVIQALREAKMSRVLILSSEVTKREGLYADPSYEAVYPNEEEQMQVNQAIQHVLEAHFLKEDAEALEKVVENISKREGVDCVVLGCTELPVLHDHHPLRTSCQLYNPIDIMVQHIGNMQCLTL